MSIGQRLPGWIYDTLPSALRGDGLAMLTCYVDDSDNDKGPVMVIAGYFGRVDDWKQFEVEAGALFSEFEIRTLHTMKFHHGKGEFLNWGILKKRDFVEKLFQIVSSCALYGVSCSVNKGDFAKMKRESTQKVFSNMSPFGHAFSRIIFGIIHKLPVLHKLPLSFVVESGNKNNGNLVKYFDWIKKCNIDWSSHLGSISFVDKGDCAAIQLADFLAFYSRKAAQQWEKDGYPSSLPVSDYFELMLKYVPHHFERSYGEMHDGSIQPGGLLPGVILAP